MKSKINWYAYPEFPYMPVYSTQKDGTIPIKALPHDAWERLMEWCEDSASRFESSVETCNGWKARELKEILAEVEK